MYGVNIFGTIATRKYQQMYVSHLVHHGHDSVDRVRLHHRQLRGGFATGANQANLNWMYVHNAVGLIFTPVGLAIAYYFIPKLPTLRCTATSCP